MLKPVDMSGVRAYDSKRTSNKYKYRVYFRYYLDAEEDYNCIKDEWRVAGETYAVSEDQAVNNVRHRTMGDVSQYKPVYTSGHWENGFEWKAVRI